MSNKLIESMIHCFTMFRLGNTGEIVIKRAIGIVSIIAALAVGAGLIWHTESRNLTIHSSPTKSHSSVAHLPHISRQDFMAGVVEGFYGPEWSFRATVQVLQFMHRQGFNTFVYAPKNAPYLRAQWNVLFPAQALKALHHLVVTAQNNRIQFVCSISPGLSIEYSSPRDQQQLLAKINQLWSIGIHSFMISFDDIPDQLNGSDAQIYHNNLALAQSKLVDRVYRDELKDGHAIQLLFTPTVYWGVQNNLYWSTLKTELNAHIPVIWTGPWVLSKVVTQKQATAVEQDIGHPLVIWDNYPVNDYTYVISHHPQLFMGPVMGRSPHLISVVHGYLFNPMLQPYPSEVALSTGAQYLEHPTTYQPIKAWVQALGQWGKPVQPALQSFAAANSVSFMNTRPLDHLDRHMTAFWNGYRHHDNLLNTALYRQFTRWNHNTRILQEKLPRSFYAQIEPWIQIYQAEAQLGMTVIRMLNNPSSASPATVQAIVARQDKINASADQLGVHTLLSNWFADAFAHVPFNN